MTAPLLLEGEITSRLNTLSSWIRGEVSICKSYHFPTFREAMRFANLLAELAEEFDHHPEMGIGWRYVNVSFTTHSVGGITQKDFDIANKADNVFLLSFGG